MIKYLHTVFFQFFYLCNYFFYFFFDTLMMLQVMLKLFTCDMAQCNASMFTNA